jgi:hypothetical protein
MSDTAKIRPFEEYIEAERGFNAVVISGRIAEGAYVVNALGTHFAFETTEVGEDQWGPFAVVRECDVPFSGEFRLCLDSNEEETMLGIFIPGDDGTGMLGAVKRAFTVWFSPLGVKDGRGSSLPGTTKPKPMPVN